MQTPQTGVERDIQFWEFRIHAARYLRGISLTSIATDELPSTTSTQRLHSSWFRYHHAHPPVAWKWPGAPVFATHNLTSTVSFVQSRGISNNQSPLTHPGQDHKMTVKSIPETLTHVSASGEANLVDVGSKAATKRTAIAFAYVSFSNTTAYNLTLQDKNKKGDVLGVSRIAGIMAAKRTSELIPLCHPIALNKVQVDLNLVAPGIEHPICSKNSYGAVSIQALVECKGPTGVEMEALSAASVAALTVYDMCKAVDKKMTIESAQVVYKSGGKSGDFVVPDWYHAGGKVLLEERKLPSPL